MRGRLRCGLLGLGLALLTGLPAWGQHATAPSGYYPPGYDGSMFTGVVTALDNAASTITLTYTHGNKTQTLVGVLHDFTATTRDKKVAHITPGSFKLGMTVTVFYLERTDKIDGKKSEYNLIFRIREGKTDVTSYPR